jgi:hypothetical protein
VLSEEGEEEEEESSGSSPTRRYRVTRNHLNSKCKKGEETKRPPKVHTLTVLRDVKW